MQWPFTNEAHTGPLQSFYLIRASELELRFCFLFPEIADVFDLELRSLIVLGRLCVPSICPGTVLATEESKQLIKIEQELPHWASVELHSTCPSECWLEDCKVDKEAAEVISPSSLWEAAVQHDMMMTNIWLIIKGGGGSDCARNFDKMNYDDLRPKRAMLSCWDMFLESNPHFFSLLVKSIDQVLYWLPGCIIHYGVAIQLSESHLWSKTPSAASVEKGYLVSSLQRMQRSWHFASMKVLACCVAYESKWMFCVAGCHS